ncbi:MAG TPA: tripartite tricarboxylate transporter substrate binding protein [Burkholderiales bacterium]|jgi:tripartite-type tricarboxylate transporter receptor subunit TctC|nr:tripartite tricarboxylate transporter substrate binding protein [Burkholderiales bacterium]
MSLSRFLITIVALAFSWTAAAQDWPTKPVKFVSPYPPGGSVDPLARLLAAKLTDSLKQQFIVENRTGASGIIGTDYVAKSAPDGYTWVFIFDTHSVHQALNSKLPFDPIKDFAPVMIVGTAPMALTTAASKPYKSFADVVAAAKAKPDTLTVGNVGNGSLGHLATILLNQAAGIKLVAVPYKGGGPLSTDTMGGQVDFAMASTAAQAQHVRGGKMRALVLTGEKRSHTMPDVPTLSEVGVKWEPAYAFWGILAPAGTPKPIVDKLHAEIVKAIKLPDVNKTLTETLGMDVLALSPEATGKFLSDAIQRWGKVVRDNNIHSE